MCFSICVLVFYLVVGVYFVYVFSVAVVSGSLLFAFVMEFKELEPMFLSVGHVAGAEVGD